MGECAIYAYPIYSCSIYTVYLYYVLSVQSIFNFNYKNLFLATLHFSKYSYSKYWRFQSEPTKSANLSKQPTIKFRIKKV